MCVCVCVRERLGEREREIIGSTKGLLTTIMPQGRVSYQDFMVDLGHPLVNRVVDGFVKVAGVSLMNHLITDSYFL